MRHRLTAALVGAALAVAGCGGDEDSGSGEQETQATTGEQQTRATTAPETQTQPEPGGTDGSVTRAEYIARADAFCKRTNAQAKGLNARLREAAQNASPGRPQLEAIEPILREGYEVQRRALGEFKQIPYPAADEEIIERVHAAMDEQTAHVGRLLDAAEAGDLERFQALVTEQDRVKLKARGVARGYGFKECGSGRNEAD